MQEKNNTLKVGFVLIILAMGYPMYSLLGSTIEGKRQNALKNADKPWAPEAHYACGWRYEVSMRAKQAEPIYAEWLQVWGGKAVCAELFPDRFDEMDEYEDDSEHAFSPPVGSFTAHKQTAEVLYDYAVRCEARLDNERALLAAKLALDPEVCPPPPEAKRKSIEILVKRRSQSSF